MRYANPPDGTADLAEEFRIETEPDRERVIVAPYGELDVATAASVADEIEGLVERYELEVKFSFISLLSFKVEVVDVNQGYEADFFHWSSHVPEGTPVIEAPSEKDEAREEGGE